MTKLMAFDTEDDSRGNPFLFNFFDGDNHFTFTTATEALDWLLEIKKPNLMIWACNLQYDLTNLFYHHANSIEITYAGSRVISAKVPYSKIYFRDTLNHWKISVKAMGERIGLPKLEANNNFNNIEYCQRDTEIVFKFVSTMGAKYTSIGAKLKSTIGGTALTHFQENTGFGRDKQNRFDVDQLAFMEKSLHGGRTEAFINKPVKGKIFVYDYNSLYPSVMEKMPFPLLKDFNWVEKIDLEKEGIAHVRINSPNNVYIPYLPYRLDSSLVFPTGKFSDYYTYFELREAQKLGYKIEKVFRALEFSGGTYYPFKTWVNNLYKSRLEAQKDNDAFLSDTYKLILNNLFGKFGQGNEKTKLLPLDKKYLRKYNCTILGNFILAHYNGDYPTHTNFIWSSYILAYAKHKIYSGLREANTKGQILYCDTDSLFILSDEPPINPSVELGDLKLEGILKYAYFKGLKNYKLIYDDEYFLNHVLTKNPDAKQTIYKCKGVPKDYAMQFFEENIVTYKKPYRLREALRRNNSKNKTKSKLIIPNYWDDFTKTNIKIYDKRKVLKNGDTRPITIK